MKFLFRNFLLNFVSLWATSYLIPGFSYTGEFRTLTVGAVGLMLINMAVIPLLKVMLLPLNLLTFGMFTWVVNVIALYFLTTMIPQFKILPYQFAGLNLGGVMIPPTDLNVLQVAIITSFLLGFISHFLHWLFN